ncbi:MAG: sulfurtransferase TusA family protein [Thermodesulfovibrio sp.]|nr:sulfurtransferase TusA family protein [Thermodesulfovibrio sp.]
MAEIVDARGLSCPEPVLLTFEAIKKIGKGEIEILVDTDTSRENVSRAAQSMGWQITNLEQKEGYYKVKIVKD